MTPDDTQRGCLITLEGGEGAGKSSALPVIEAWIRDRGLEVDTTREPGGTESAERLRGLLMDVPDWPPVSELLLMFAARAEHLRHRIEPALAAGRWVVCDRFTDSSYAYQGAARGLGEAAVAQLETLVQGDFRPDLTLIFDLPPEQGIARTRERGVNNRFDTEALTFHETVRQAFLHRARQAPARYAVLDAAQPLEQVREALISVLEDKWPTRT
ncbi:MAG: dTMP kinase [Salinisphaeraceae bacterium]|jgi:dTMP kinase|nr:dTMP kinase [Salinisphaeraceae bacterium]